MSCKNIVVLGGYGNFGKRIVETLAKLEHIAIFVAGRSEHKATQLCKELAKTTTTPLLPACIDINACDFKAQLARLNPFLVIHTGGPFQGQDYTVAQACINLGSHYIDLADDRRFVCDISQLDKAAKQKQLLIVSGASSVPGLSSTVVDHYLPQFKSLHSIDFAIAPGNKAERGEATVSAILSYTGHPFKVFRGSQWVEVFGWGESKQRQFGGIIGKRWLANVDIPDLELFPARYPSVRCVHFQAGLELASLHHGMSFMSKLVQTKLVSNWAPLSKWIVKASNLFLPLGSDKGAMQITLQGLGHDELPLQIDWTLYADNGVGPYIPTISAIILAQKLIAGSNQAIGAIACQGLYSLDEFDQCAKTWGIYHSQSSSQAQEQ